MKTLFAASVVLLVLDMAIAGYLFALNMMAQAGSSDPVGLAGSSGWFGAGLLGLVLSWLLLVYLPRQDVRNDAKDKHLAEILAAKDARHEAVVMNINAHCEKELTVIADKFIVKIEELMRTLKS